MSNIYNLTNQPISSSFQPLLQIDSGSAVRDGSGSLVDNLIVTASFALTASFAENVIPIDTGSLLTTASFDNGTRDLTFTKGDSSTFAVNIPDVSGSDITALNAFTASQDIYNTGINNYTSSTDIRITDLENFSSSLDATFATDAELASATQSLINSIATKLDTGSYLTDSASFDTRIDSLETFSSSLDANFVSETEFGIYTQSNDGKVNSLIDATGSYATTGSNNFFGNQTISGSLTSTIVETNTYTNPQTITDNVTIPTGLNGLIVGETTIVGDYTIEGNSEVYVFTPPALLDTSSFATTGPNTFVGDQTVSGSFFMLGQSINWLANGNINIEAVGNAIGELYGDWRIKDKLTIEPQDTLPTTPQHGMLITSGSELYFYDGSNWREVNLT